MKKPRRRVASDTGEPLALWAGDVFSMVKAIEQSGKKRRLRLRVTMDYPFHEVWEIDRVIRACRHDKPRRTLACWNCYRNAIRPIDNRVLLMITRVPAAPSKRRASASGRSSA